MLLIPVYTCDAYPQDLEALERHVVVIQGLLEGGMSPNQWTIMFHLLEHMPAQMRQWGPVRETWMFCMESYFGKLTRMIKTRKHPIANILRSYSIAKATNLSIAIMAHAVEKQTKGYVPAVRLPPCIPYVDRFARLGPKNRDGRLTPALLMDLRVFLKNTEEFNELRELWRIARQGTRDVGYEPLQYVR